MFRCFTQPYRISVTISVKTLVPTGIHCKIFSVSTIAFREIAQINDKTFISDSLKMSCLRDAELNNRSTRTKHNKSYTIFVFLHLRPKHTACVCSAQRRHARSDALGPLIQRVTHTSNYAFVW